MILAHAPLGRGYVVSGLLGSHVMSFKVEVDVTNGVDKRYRLLLLLLVMGLLVLQFNLETGKKCKIYMLNIIIVRQQPCLSVHSLFNWPFI